MNKKLSEYAELLTECDTRYDMLQTLIEIGKDLDEMSREEQSQKNHIPGCVSNVHMNVSDDPICIKISADALIVKGYAKIIVDAFNGMTVLEFKANAQKDIQEFIQKTQIDSSFLASRANAFGNIFTYLEKKVQ